MGLKRLPSLPPPQALPEFNEFCNLCNQNYAETACLCVYPLPKVCGQCAEAHSKKASVSFPHTFVPMENALEVRSEGELKQAQGRLKGVAAVQAVIQEMEQADKKVDEVFTELVQVVLHQKAQTKADIGTMRAEFEQRYKDAAKQVERNLFSKTYVPETGAAAEVWSGQVTLPKFKWTVTATDLRPVLSTVVALRWEVTSAPLPQPPPKPVSQRVQYRAGEGPREERKPEERKVEDKKVEAKRPTGYTLRANRGRTYADVVPVLSSTTLRYYAPRTSDWHPSVPLSRTIDFDNSSSYTLLPDFSLFACGRYSPISPTAFIITPDSGQVYALRPMCVARYQHGVIAYKADVFVFGGHERAGLTSHCEKYALETDTWQNLPALSSPRECFTPVRCELFVYIIGGRGTLSSERFHLQTELFELIAVKMDRPEASCGLCLDRKMLILQSNYVLEVNSRDLTVSRKHYEGVFAWSNFAPVCVGGSVYMVSLYNGLIEQVETEEYRRETIRIN